MEYDLSEKRVALLMGERLGRAVMNGTVKGLVFSVIPIWWFPQLALMDFSQTGDFILGGGMSLCYLIMFLSWFNNHPFGYGGLSPVAGMPLKLIKEEREKLRTLQKGSHL